MELAALTQRPRFMRSWLLLVIVLHSASAQNSNNDGYIVPPESGTEIGPCRRANLASALENEYALHENELTEAECRGICTACACTAYEYYAPNHCEIHTGAIVSSSPEVASVSTPYVCWVRNGVPDNGATACEGIETGPDGGEDPCFPPSAKVIMANGKLARVDSLVEGDSIVAATMNGSITTDVVSMLSIAEAEKRASFITLRTDGNRSLTLTGEHHIPVGRRCCEVLKKAKDVVVGDMIWAMEEHHKIVTQKVETIAFDKGNGLFSPVLANGGFPVVDGFVTSYDSIMHVFLATKGLSTLISICRATRTCEFLRRSFFGSTYDYVKPFVS